MINGVYEERSPAAIIHAIELRNNTVVRAWTYQVGGEYAEPDFAAEMVGRSVEQIDLSGYRLIEPDEARARQRVQGDSELRLFADILLRGDDEHYRWLADAPTYEIVEWASRIAALEDEAARMAGDWLTPDEVAVATGSAASTWRNKAARGQIPGAVKKGKQWLLPRATLRALGVAV